MHNLNIINSKQVRTILESDNAKVRELVHAAYIMHDNDLTVNPASFFLRFPDKPKSRIIGLPAALTSGDKIAGIKWIASNPDNIKANQPRASAVIILNDYETGFPLACMDGAIISATRTAVSAVLAAESIKNKLHKTVKNIGVVGSGPIMQYVVKYLLQDSKEWPVESLRVLDLDVTRAVDLISKASAINNQIKYEISKNVDKLVQASDMVIFATSALEPYCTNLDLFKHNPIVLNISLRDVGPEIILASNNVTDDVDHVLQAKTSLHLASELVQNRDFINGELGGLLQDKFNLDSNKPTIFSPMGLGVLDLILAQHVYQSSLLAKQYTEVEDFLTLDV